jgi:hypothetical protein
MYLPPPSGQALYESPMNGTPQYVSGYPPLLPGQVASSPYSSVQATAAVFNAEVPQVFSAGAPYVSECTVQKCYQSAQPKKHARQATPPSLPNEALQKNWPELLEHCKKSDKVMLENWDGEIDTLLVFVRSSSRILSDGN